MKDQALESRKFGALSQSTDLGQGSVPLSSGFFNYKMEAHDPLLQVSVRSGMQACGALARAPQALGRFDRFVGTSATDIDG